ncbi:MAG: tRNA uridine-5-carboxymethylaminomethyl(34) synthesis GTPase MnmE [Lactobacillales bacterium]|jgi:tRNA modification GTPase|nr:tRNA uridine-5-carboxymethylaminomethyl(34) synthesis GTPase MnmE [Lactobacillales bacterium]
MSIIKEFDTIAAISTANAIGAIGIVRLSGEAAIKIADSFYRGATPLVSVESHRIVYGHLYDGDGELVDEVMVSVLRAPKTFTREDVVEINCHGGMVTCNRVLRLLLNGGARLAEPGEFTKRAFLNGRIDLSQSEAIMDLIHAKTEKSAQLALNQLDGRLSKLIGSLRRVILDIIAQVEVNIDYPEYEDVSEMTHLEFMDKAKSVSSRIDKLIKSAAYSKLYRDGITTAIIGRPNVGKSTLLNKLLDEEKAIVTEIAGTTRDTIEEFLNINGIPLRLIDTAGIRETDDVVEKIGVERSQAALAKAQLVLLVLNYNEELTSMDRELLELSKDKKRIIILNKSDLEHKLDVADLPDEFIEMSLKNDATNVEIEEAIEVMFNDGHIQLDEDSLVTNTRHVALLEEARASLNEAISGIENGMPIDLVQIDFTDVWNKLGEITGDSMPDELITELFTQFCLGK